MASTTQHIAARDDLDLQQRLIAAAEQMGVQNASSSVVANLGALVSRQIEVDGSPTSIADVHAYAADVREQYLADEKAMSPGLNPGAVTDVILNAALTEVLGDPAQTSE